MLTAPGVGSHNSNTSRRGKKEVQYSRDRNARQAPRGERGRRACFVTPDLLTTRREKEKKGEDNKGDETKEKVIYIHEKTDVFCTSK